MGLSLLGVVPARAAGREIIWLNVVWRWPGVHGVLLHAQRISPVDSARIRERPWRIGGLLIFDRRGVRRNIAAVLASRSVCDYLKLAFGSALRANLF